MPRLPRVLKWMVIPVIALGLLFVAVMGFAHTKPGRPLLAVVGPLLGMSPKSCPFGYDKVASPEQREEARRRFSITHRGAELARARPALGFKLDDTRRADVEAWAHEHGIPCTKPKGGSDLECSNIPSEILPDGFKGMAVRTLWLNFGKEDRLITVTAVRKDPRVTVVSAAFQDVASALSREAGSPAKVDADSSPERLASGTLQQATAEYRFRNYYAVARATNMGDGFLLTEDYKSLAQ